MYCSLEVNSKVNLIQRHKAKKMYITLRKAHGKTHNIVIRNVRHPPKKCDSTFNECLFKYVYTSEQILPFLGQKTQF